MEYGAEKAGGRNVSKAALLVGAAGLFLFIVGVKRKHRLDAEREVGERSERADAMRVEGEARR